MKLERTRAILSRRAKHIANVLILSLCVHVTDNLLALELPPGGRRTVIVELYHDGQDDRTQRADAVLSKLASTRCGLLLIRRDLNEPKNQLRHAAIAKHYRLPAHDLPVVYGCNRAVTLDKNIKAFAAECEQMLKMTVYVRRGCTRCARAKEFLTTYVERYPAIQLVYRDLVTDRTAVAEINRLVQKHRKHAVSVPTFYLCDQLLVGFDRSETTGRRLDELLERWTTPQGNMSSSDSRSAKPENNSTADAIRTLHVLTTNALTAVLYQPELTAEDDTESDVALPLPQDPQVGDLDLPIPTDSSDEVIESPGTRDDQYIVELPWFGEFDIRRHGLSAFTVAIGLVDGFNPCAMWVLMFLLSLLVNLQRRSRILAVAGTFVVVSGLAYFAFMVAWLNVFMLIGLLRPVQVALGLLGITIGAIHIKDFFALKHGLSLSIPEAAKPTIYSRTRAIITAENLTGAIAGATILAVLVNTVELLCTAGLPALYTEVLTSYELPIWKNYAYVGLYIIAYMLDDALMVAAVVLTLSKRKLQEAEGRWLKLISGIVILALGLVVLIQPEWMEG